MALTEYRPGTTFPGRLGRTVGESEPAWPMPNRARPGAPNVMYIVLDDTGYGQFGCYGSPIDTPNLDRLADNGLRYTNMHTTALCSPSRSCMLTGRNHHSNGMSCITEGSEGFPGSNGTIPFENGFLSEMLLDSRGSMRFADERPQISAERDVYTYYPGTQVVPENVAAKVLNRAHSITAEVRLSAGDEGVVVSHGSNIGGYALFVQDGKLHYIHNYVGSQELHVVSESEIPDGKHALRYEFEPTGAPDLAAGKGTPGRARLFIDDEQVGQADFPVTVPIALGIGSGVSVGRNPGSPVSARYESPFAFTGAITAVTIDVSGETLHDDDQVKAGQARVAMARQ